MNQIIRISTFTFNFKFVYYFRKESFFARVISNTWNSIKNKKALPNNFVCYWSQHKCSILFHPSTGFADLKGKAGKKEKLYAHMQKHSVYIYTTLQCTVSLLLLSTSFSLNKRRRDINLILCASSEHQRISFWLVWNVLTRIN